MPEPRAFSFDASAPLKRTKSESSAQAQALHDYALLGPGRSLGKLLEIYRGQGEGETRVPTRRQATLEAWSSRYLWQPRVARFDELQRQAELEAWEARREDYRERAYQLAAERGLARVEEMLSYPLTREVVTQKDKAGRPTVIEIKPVRWSMHSAATLLTAVNQVARLALGEATERVESETTVHQVDQFSNYSDEDLDDAIAQLETRAHAAREGALRAPAFDQGSAPRGPGPAGARDGERDSGDHA